MKITYKGNPPFDNRKKANEGCEVCPVCGRKDTVIEDGYYNFYNIGLNSHFSVDRYVCTNCHSKWQSDPYIVEQSH